MENMKVQLKEMLENWKKPHWPKIILFISSSLAGFTLILIILEYTRRIGSLPEIPGFRIEKDPEWNQRLFSKGISRLELNHFKEEG